MKRYGNLHGHSGVTAYAAGPGYIEVRFRSGWIYRYTLDSAGRIHVEAMIALAASGRGLATYVSRTAAVRNGYASKRLDS